MGPKEAYLSSVSASYQGYLYLLAPVDFTTQACCFTEDTYNEAEIIDLLKGYLDIENLGIVTDLKYQNALAFSTELEKYNPEIHMESQKLQNSQGNAEQED